MSYHLIYSLLSVLIFVFNHLVSIKALDQIIINGDASMIYYTVKNYAQASDINCRIWVILLRLADPSSSKHPRGISGRKIGDKKWI